MGSSARRGSGRSTPGWVRGRNSRCATRSRAATSRARKEIILDIAGPGTRKAELSWRETAAKLGIAMAGYVEPGPLRAPFLDIPPEVLDGQRKRVERWQRLCAKYAPAYEAKTKRAANA